MINFCIPLVIIVLGEKKTTLFSSIVFNPLPDNKILDWSKLKQIADDILEWS